MHVRGGRVVVTFLNDEADGSVNMSAVNEFSIQVTIVIDRGPRGGKFSQIVLPRSAAEVALPAGFELGSAAAPKLTILLGGPSAVDTAYLYALPFGVPSSHLALPASPGIFGKLSSRDEGIDFDMPPGEAILAMRDGVVLAVNDAAPNVGRLDDHYLDDPRYTNFVLILHSDGTIGEYSHLSRSVFVTVGSPVQRGQRLGLSGGSGFAGHPITRVGVFFSEPDGVGYRYVPLKFRVGPGVTELAVPYAKYSAWEY